MKRLRFALMASLLALGGAAGQAMAHGWGHEGWGHDGWGYGPRIGIDIGAPFWGGYYPGPYYPSYPPYYYPPPAVVAVPVQPPTYVEQAPAEAPPPPAQNYWYHCAKPEGYYPYVKDCPGGWQKVVPQPPSQ